jgi:hypothetical protein
MSMPPRRDDAATHAAPSHAGELYAFWIGVMRWLRLGVGILLCLLILALWGGFDVPAPSGHARPSDHIALDIMPVKAGGPAQDYAAYVPSTLLSAPAHSVVSVTIRNFDLDATPLPATSSRARVSGTVGGVASVDGSTYRALDPAAIAHTFTIPQLGVNVPIPGHSASGKHYVTVTFSFRTGAPGTYDWQCFDPCGDGPDGLDGPMAAVSYMQGTLTVEA